MEPSFEWWVNRGSRSVALKVANSRSRSVVLKVDEVNKVPIATDRDRDCSDLCCDKVRGARRHRRLDSEVKDPACFNFEEFQPRAQRPKHAGSFKSDA